MSRVFALSVVLAARTCATATPLDEKPPPAEEEMAPEDTDSEIRCAPGEIDFAEGYCLEEALVREAAAMRTWDLVSSPPEASRRLAELILQRQDPDGEQGIWPLVEFVQSIPYLEGIGAAANLYSVRLLRGGLSGDCDEKAVLMSSLISSVPESLRWFRGKRGGKVRVTRAVVLVVPWMKHAVAAVETGFLDRKEYDGFTVLTDTGLYVPIEATTIAGPGVFTDPYMRAALSSLSGRLTLSTGDGSVEVRGPSWHEPVPSAESAEERRRIAERSYQR